MLPLMAWHQSILLLLLFGVLVYYLRKHVWLLLPTSFVAVRVGQETVTLIKRDGKECPGEILGNSFVTPVLIVLNVLLKGEARASSVIIFSDSIDKAHFRELRVVLRWGCKPVS
jgi:hypothetical protein